MSSGIVSFLEGRDNAIKAWKLDGYLPLEEVDLALKGMDIQDESWLKLQGFDGCKYHQGANILSLLWPDHAAISVHAAKAASSFLIAMLEGYFRSDKIRLGLSKSISAYPDWRLTTTLDANDDHVSVQPKG